MKFERVQSWDPKQSKRRNWERMNKNSELGGGELQVFHSFTLPFQMIELYLEVVQAKMRECLGSHSQSEWKELCLWMTQFRDHQHYWCYIHLFLLPSSYCSWLFSLQQEARLQAIQIHILQTEPFSLTSWPGLGHVSH